MSINIYGIFLQRHNLERHKLGCLERYNLETHQLDKS